MINISHAVMGQWGRVSLTPKSVVFNQNMTSCRWSYQLQPISCRLWREARPSPSEPHWMVTWWIGCHCAGRPVPRCDSDPSAVLQDDTSADRRRRNVMQSRRRRQSGSANTQSVKSLCDVAYEGGAQSPTRDTESRAVRCAITDSHAQ